MLIVLEESFAARIAVVVIAEDLPLKAAAGIPHARDFGVGVLQELPRGPGVYGPNGGAHGTEPRIDRTGVEDDERVRVGGCELFREETARGIEDGLEYQNE